VPVPNPSHGTSNWDKHNLSQWDKQIGTGCACPSGTGPAAGCPYQTCPTPLLVPWDKSYTHAGGLSLSRDKFYTHDGACPSSTCPNLFHKVGLQGRGILSQMFMFLTDTTKTDFLHILVRTHLLVLTCQHSCMLLVIIDQIYRKRSRSILIMV